MKIGIVLFSGVDTKSLSARHYLGPSEKDLERARASVTRAERRLKMAKERLAKMEKEGPLPGVKMIDE